jgi:hypothetical protein
MVYWLAALLAGDDLVLRDATRIRAAGDAVRARHAALADEIDHHLRRPECERFCDYRPALLPAVVNRRLRRYAAGARLRDGHNPDAPGLERIARGRTGSRSSPCR